MNVVKIEAGEFAAVGREARTTNAREMSGKGAIGKLWSETPNANMAVYSEYESDKDGEYNYLLGWRTDLEAIFYPERVYRSIEKGEYMLLKFEGPVTPGAVVGLWQQVWDLERQGKIARAYKTDFELYGGAGMELYVGIKR